MRNNLTKVICLLIVSVVCLTFSSCGKEKSGFSADGLVANQNTLTRKFSFDKKNSSEAVKFDSERINDFITGIKNTVVDYGYAELFNYEEAMAGIDVDHTVTAHKFSALDGNGKLTKEHLLEIVNKNTEEYLKNLTTEPLVAIDNQDYLLRVCEIITDVVNDILKKYPDIDKERVYCNLGNLKVIEKQLTFDFAAVEPGMVLHLNSATANMADIMIEKNMYNVIVHESMHIIQYGCTCEPLKEGSRRCGLAHSYADCAQDYSDWRWFAEGSAERMACLYINASPMTYETMVRYILSMDLATMLQKNVPSDYAETINFYSDIQRLFDLFGCETERDKEEVYHLIYGLEMMQIQPDDVKAAYKENYGVEFDDSVAADFNNKIKRPIVKTLTKNFYRNLARTLTDESVSKNDLLFLINLYECAINGHLNLNKSDYDNYNIEFEKWYGQLRKDFFECLSNVSEADYFSYNAEKSETTLNASLSWLDADKQRFLSDKYEDTGALFKYSEK